MSNNKNNQHRSHCQKNNNHNDNKRETKPCNANVVRELERERERVSSANNKRVFATSLRKH